MKRLSIHTFKNLPPHEKRITLSTLLTIGRMVLVPFIVFSMITQHWDAAFILFFIASVTDFLDGNLARWRNEQTYLGAFLDPIADKFLLLSCFFTLAFVQSPLFSIPMWFVLFVLSKEIIIFCGSLFIFYYKGHMTIRPTILGKMTTFLQICFILWLFACYFFTWVPVKTYYTMLAVVLVVVFFSLLQYVRIGLRQVKR